MTDRELLDRAVEIINGLLYSIEEHELPRDDAEIFLEDYHRERALRK